MFAFSFFALQRALSKSRLVMGFHLLTLLLAFLICGTVAPNVYAETITARSCSQANVQDALNSANRGDTVTIPAGDCTWSSTVTFNKALTIQGAGKANTIIRSNISVPSLTMSRGPGKYQMLYFRSSSPSSDENVTLRITGITFDMNYKSSGVAIYNEKLNAPNSIDYPIRKLIIDNCDFIDAWDGNVSNTKLRGMECCL